MDHTRLYVGDLAPQITQQQLSDLFAQVGGVVSVDLAAHSTFAFIEMASAAEAKQAADVYNKYDLDGSHLIVYTVPPRSHRRIASS